MKKLSGEKSILRSNSQTFEIALNLAYENKQEVYNSWTFGIAFNKLLWRKD